MTVTPKNRLAQNKKRVTSGRGKDRSKRQKGLVGSSRSRGQTKLPTTQNTKHPVCEEKPVDAMEVVRSSDDKCDGDDDFSARVLSCLVLYTPLAGRMLRAGGRAGPPPPPQYMPRRALASPRVGVGARITRVRFSTKSNYLSHIRSSHIRLQSSVDLCQTGVASESLSTAVASLPGSHFLSHLSLPLTYNPPIHSLSSAKPGPYRLPHPTTQFGVRLLQIALIPPVPCFHWRLSALAATKGGEIQQCGLRAAQQCDL
jgi:hypothetical protein